MRTPVDDRFRGEARAFALRFGCEQCAAFDPERESCAFGYPTAEHHVVDLDRAVEVVFCKAFELG